MGERKVLVPNCKKVEVDGSTATTTSRRLLDRTEQGRLASNLEQDDDSMLLTTDLLYIYRVCGVNLKDSVDGVIMHASSDTLSSSSRTS